MGWTLPQGFLQYAEAKEQEKKQKSGQVGLADHLNTVLNEQSIESDCHNNSQDVTIGDDDIVAHRRLTTTAIPIVTPMIMNDESEMIYGDGDLQAIASQKIIENVEKIDLHTN